MISWGREAGCGLRKSVFGAWSTGKALEHKLHHHFHFLEARRPPFQLVIDCRLLDFQANSSHQLRVHSLGKGQLWARSSPCSQLSCIGAQPTKGIWAESCNSLDHDIFLRVCLTASAILDVRVEVNYPRSNPQPRRKCPSFVTRTEQLGSILYKPWRFPWSWSPACLQQTLREYP